MNKVRTAGGAATGAAGSAAGGRHHGAAGAVRAQGRAAPIHDVAPNLDTGVLFVGDAPTLQPPPPRLDALAPFTRLVGAQVGPGNPAWGADALALLRSLQKRLIGHALTLPPAARRGCLDAIAVLEPAVGMRLRIMQMQMSELEGGAATPGVRTMNSPRSEEAGHAACD